jgi:hypothetical protein
MILQFKIYNDGAFSLDEVDTSLQVLLSGLGHTPTGFGNFTCSYNACLSYKEYGYKFNYGCELAELMTFLNSTGCRVVFVQVTA